MAPDNKVEVRFQIPGDVIDRLRGRLGLSTNTDVVREALTLLDWASSEKEKGRVILSADKDGGNLTKLWMSSLENVKERSTVAVA
jgi:hypothetical protein